MLRIFDLARKLDASLELVKHVKVDGDLRDIGFVCIGGGLAGGSKELISGMRPTSTEIA